MAETFPPQDDPKKKVLKSLEELGDYLPSAPERAMQQVGEQDEPYHERAPQPESKT